MDKAKRVERHIRICIRIAGQLFVPPADPFVLPLGPEYAANMSRLLARRTAIFEAIIADLSSLSLEQLEEEFATDGSPTSDAAKELCKRHGAAVQRAFGRLNIWYHAPIFRTKELADFGHWGRSDFLSIDEIVWLSVGLEPTPELIAAIKPFDRYGNAQKLDAVATYVSRHKEIIRRKFDPDDFNGKPGFQELHDWITDVSLDVHPEFLRIINRTKGVGPGNAKPAVEISSSLDGREKVSMSKLIAAMAIDAYGFDPKARRSDIPNEIQGIADRLGLELTSNTIRKYLKQGAELLPEDWKPE